MTNQPPTKEQIAAYCYEFIRRKYYPCIPDKIGISLSGEYLSEKVKAPFADMPETPEQIEGMIDRWKMQDKLFDKALKTKNEVLTTVTLHNIFSHWKYEGQGMTPEQSRVLREIEMQDMISEWKELDKDYINLVGVFAKRLCSTKKEVIDFFRENLGYISDMYQGDIGKQYKGLINDEYLKTLKKMNL